MSIPAQYPIPADDFNRLKAATEWYEAMPEGLEVGDRFHENMFDFQQSFLDEFEEGDEYYFSHFEVADGKIFACYGLEHQPATNDEQYERMQIISK